MKFFLISIVSMIVGCSTRYRVPTAVSDRQIEKTASICCKLMKKFRNNPNNEGGNESVVLSDMWVKGMHGVEWTSCDKSVFLSYLVRCYGPLNNDDLRVLAEQMDEGDAVAFGRIVEQHETGAHDHIVCDSGIRLSDQAAEHFISALRTLISMRNQMNGDAMGKTRL